MMFNVKFYQQNFLSKFFQRDEIENQIALDYV